MRKDDEIHHCLQRAFGPCRDGDIVVVNESHKHKGHAGDNGTGQTHYLVCIRSKVFNDKTLLQSQRLVLSALKDFMEGEGAIHALSIKTQKNKG